MDAGRRRERFERWFGELSAIGRLPGGGWRRYAWTEDDRRARDWFSSTASSIGLAVEPDGNGNLWAWWGEPGPGAVVSGSHLDTVAEGGAYDGALGVVSALAAVAEMAGDGGTPPARPVAVVAFADEEGGRFNLPCFGSRLLTGALDPEAVLDRADPQGTTVAAAMRDAGLDPGRIGADPERLARIAAFVEVHVEQGRGLVDFDRPIAVATAIWPHGRWRIRLTGESNHAGTTRLVDRHDPILVAAACTLAARQLASAADMVATVGRVAVKPNAPNAIASHVTIAVDARGPDDTTLDSFVTELTAVAHRVAAEHGVGAEVHVDSRTEGVVFDPVLGERVETALRHAGIPVAWLPTAAGHDAGILAAHVPTTMLFVRNPTGASHTPSESASVDDCLVGIDALTTVLRELVWG
jgi:N-carbamoyl-L-amino-acid hydrolase